MQDRDRGGEKDRWGEGDESRRWVLELGLEEEAVGGWWRGCGGRGKGLTGGASGQPPRAISFTKKERLMVEGEGRIILGRDCLRLYASVRERGRDRGEDKGGRDGRETALRGWRKREGWVLLKSPRGDIGEIGPRGENVDDFALRMTSSRCLCLIK